MPTNADLFRKYPNRYFVETGSYCGSGIQAALDAGFERVYSIELAPRYAEICRSRFAGDGRVEVIEGDSAEVLPRLLQDLDAPATFWLDGHHSCEDTALGPKWSPLMDELAAIAASPIRTHTILVDDMRCWDKDNVVIGFGRDEIVAAIRAINPGYEVHFEDGFSPAENLPDDILIATVQRAAQARTLE